MKNSKVPVLGIEVPSAEVFHGAIEKLRAVLNTESEGLGYQESERLVTLMKGETSAIASTRA